MLSALNAPHGVSTRSHFERTVATNAEVALCNFSESLHLPADLTSAFPARMFSNRRWNHSSHVAVQYPTYSGLFLKVAFLGHQDASAG